MMKKCKKPISVLLSILMVLSVFGGTAFTASAAEKELTETFNLGEYCHYDEDWEEFLADAHTGLNVTVAPTGNYIYVQDNCWFTHEDQRHEAIRVTVNNGDVIRKIVIKEYFYDWDTWRVCVNGRTIPGTTTTIDEDYNWVTFETVNAAQALIESPDGGLVEQLIVYYGDPVPTTHTITDASVNGTVTASVNGTDVTEAEENADVTLTVAPAEGYQFVSISAGDVSLTTVTEGSQYSFTMPTKDVTVTAVFEEIPAPELPDVIKDCTYYDSYCGFYANVPFAGMFSDIQNGAIICDSYSETDKSIMDTKDYSYKFYDENGTELQAENIYHDDSADGYGFRVIMNVFRFSNPISGPLYIVATAPAPTYTITWKNYDDSDIGTSTVAEGETPTFSDTIGEIKEKPDNALYTYTFSGWTPDVVAATADATYTATFTATPKQHQHDGITFDKWTSDNSLPTEAGNYVLTSDVTLSGTWTVPTGETNLCLAGYTIRQSGSGSVIQLNNANEKLTVYDDGTTGSITGGNTTGNGGGVQITAGTFELKNGSIEGNIADNGGGVSLQNSGNFIMSGGTIRYNCGYGNTGGVLVLNNNFTMTGGSIQYNVGKVFGGIGIASSQPNMSGTPVVEGNVFFSDTTRTNTKITKTDSGYTLASGGTPSDIRHATANGLKINIVGALENGAQIGIFNNSQTAAFTNGYKTYNPNDDPKDYFFSNDGNRFIMRDTAKEAQLGGYFTVTWKGADGTVLETDENVVTGTTPEFNGTIPEKPEDDEATYTATWSPDIAPVTGDVTYTLYYRPTTKRLYKIYIQCTSYNFLNMTVDKTSLWSTFNGSPIYNGTGYSLHHIQITSGADVMTASGNMITVKKQGTASFRGFVNGSQYLNFNLTATPYYTVTWENYDGTELQTGLVLGGATPVYTGAEPEKETADGNAYYPFLGWSPEVETATADTTYTAVFSDTAVPYQHTHDGIKFKEWTNTDSLPKYASNYCLTSDVTTSATWTVPAGEMNLCLNGHKIDANGGNYAVITIGNGRTLNLYNPESGGVITGANHTAEAGGVMVSNGGHFNMYGGSIEGNRSNNGGGVSANGSNAVFHMYGGSIQYNEGYDNTGGILLQGNTTFTMSGGSIQHNAGKNYGGIGTYQATIIFDGDVNISDNYIYSGGTSGKIAKSGDTYTLDTTGGTPCNVKTAHANDRIKVTGQLTLTHKIGIIRQGTKGVFTTGYTTSGNTADPSEYFYSDDPNYTVGLSNGEAAIVDQYTVTWNNWDNSNLETDTRAAVGATPSYDGAEPTKEADNDYTYTFSGWTSSGGTFYAKGTALPAVSGNETYTAQFTAKPKTLIAGHSLSLDGNIGINFYLDPSVAGLTAADVNSGNLSYSFAWVDQADTKAKVDVAEQARQSQAFTVSDDGKYIIVTCHVCAAEMTCGVNASFTLGNKTESEVYSVRKYGDSVLNPTAEWLAKYKTQYPDNTAKSYNNLAALVTKMLDYGAKAQTVFGIKTGDPANTGLDYTMSSDTPDFDAAIQKPNGRLADNPASSDFYGENFKAPSLVFLDYSTLKLYFENKDGSLSTSGLTKWNNYYYIKHENIAASQLDTLQTFTVSGKTFRYSALDYAKVLATSANTDNANLAKALYWYNQAANAYFG